MKCDSWYWNWPRKGRGSDSQYAYGNKIVHHSMHVKPSRSRRCKFLWAGLLRLVIKRLAHRRIFGSGWNILANAGRSLRFLWVFWLIPGKTCMEVGVGSNSSRNFSLHTQACSQKESWIESIPTGRANSVHVHSRSAALPKPREISLPTPGWAKLRLKWAMPK